MLGVFVFLFELLVLQLERLGLDGLHLAERRVIELGGADEVEHVGHVDLDMGGFQHVVELLGLLLRRVDGVERLDQLF